MTSVMVGGGIAIFVFLSSLLIGRSIRRALLGSADSLTSTDLLLGYGLTGVVLIFSLRYVGSMWPGRLVLVGLLLWSIANVVRHPLRRAPVDPVIMALAVTFLAAIGWGSAPLAFEFGTVFRHPEIFDAPKHLFALTALAAASSWPPESAFMPGMSFAYNFAFYAPPAALIGLVRGKGFVVSIYPWLTVLASLGALWASLDLARVLGATPRQLRAVALFSTWVGGLAALIIVGRPALGYRLYAEGIVSLPIWVDEPLVSGLFVPQHLFAASTVVGLLTVCAICGAVVVRMLLCVVLALAGGLSSLILFPHISMSLGIVGLVMMIQATSWRDRLLVAGLLVLYALAFWPFGLEAARWHGGTGGALIAFPPAAHTWFVLALSFGPIVIFAAAGVTRVCRSTDVVAIATVAVMGVAGAATFVLRYPDAAIKSTLLLRLLMTSFCGFGFLVLWDALKGRVLKSMILIVIGVGIAINLPTARVLLSPPVRLSEDEAAFLKSLQHVDGIVLFDGVIDQWLPALRDGPIITDFRPFRNDAYMPPEQRSAYAALFEKSPEARERLLANDIAGVVATREAEGEWRGRFGLPRQSAFGLLFFQR